MKTLTIVVPESRANLSSIAGTLNIFDVANRRWKDIHGYEMFGMQLAGIADDVSFNEGMIRLKPNVNLADIRQTDLIIIPSLNDNFDEIVATNGQLITWLQQQYKAGTPIASICTGAFLLAATGILDRKNCSTHWAYADQFRAMFPRVKLKPDLLITDENGLYTSGGAYSFLNFVIYLIEKYYDRETAIYCAKGFQIEMDRNSQSAFSIFAGQRKHNDPAVKAAQDYLENNVSCRISVKELSARFALGRRNFDRRFYRATGNSPLEYAQRIKIEAAKKAFETTKKSITEVMFEIGYADQQAFRDTFRKITGLSPMAYRAKFNKDIAR